MSKIVDDLRIVAEKPLSPPAVLKKVLPLSEQGAQFVQQARNTIADIVHGRDKRLLVVTGPCSIHDPLAAVEYAQKLKQLQLQYADSLYIVMRVYFEKPRTTVGWKGFINDPHLDDSFDLETGLTWGRELLLKMVEMQLPTATEALDPISPQYMSDLISWSAIGARTVESQTHREMASGLSMPVGFKNGTDGNLNIALNALQSAASGHSFIGINQRGEVSLVQTAGNPDGHIILRGGAKPNYDEQSIGEALAKLDKLKLPRGIVVDCSHGNSNKDHNRQGEVAQNVLAQRLAGNDAIIGIMLESHLFAGRQDLIDGKAEKYGVSVTDACIDWDTTAQLLAALHQQMQPAVVAA
ncbi:3-deoxy-7-phosphoheptulonate synthase [Rheinheimera pacifica]|uniref:3-deoxy-7-phosphoheptulonate synthase n=1 Tax=Rheinheimera pacifica TaxID=173990 RepID=UPI000CC73CAF|nr:3-deoxy-7-phosphoheptulonate synthase [Rheinheimera pacifica]MDR6983851.1 3-deoxy-7-phosphoheptulonate synthase [Rheinheimera pacifica]PKM17502.1 MAG: 3-deoxy-7-phosphoheptulonate synthase [Gammaproteobacteria bacterium HGW-Gammaproteobacteria-15]